MHAFKKNPFSVIQKILKLPEILVTKWQFTCKFWWNWATSIALDLDFSPISDTEMWCISPESW